MEPNRAWLLQAFYGSCNSYDKAIAMGDGAEPLVEALFRNVYMGAGDRSAAEVLERYVVRELLSLQLTSGCHLRAKRQSEADSESSRHGDKPGWRALSDGARLRSGRWPRGHSTMTPKSVLPLSSVRKTGAKSRTARAACAQKQSVAASRRHADSVPCGARIGGKGVRTFASGLLSHALRSREHAVRIARDRPRRARCTPQMCSGTRRRQQPG